MSNLNLEWLQENFAGKHITVFDIGCADMYDTLRMKGALPDATFYAFECANCWLEQNLVTSKIHNIHYVHAAISNVDSKIPFYPSLMRYEENWPWSGSTIIPGNDLLVNHWEWGEPYVVNSIKLSTFCNNISPDIVHIDAQGAEYNIFSHLGNCRPSAIWTEISEFSSYDTGITYNEFYNLMTSLGYIEKFNNDYDALYVLSTASLTQYHEKD